MCSNCKAQVDRGVQALEAIANGEEVPALPEPIGLPEGAMPIPMIVAEMGDRIGIVTTREGWGAIKAMMAILGGLQEMPEGE